MKNLREDAFRIIKNSIDFVLPEKAVQQELEKMSLEDNIHVVAIGKAAWRMAKAAKDFLKDRVKDGIVITKYGHSQGTIESLQIYEAGHPIPDDNTIKSTKKAIELVQNLGEGDVVLFLVSGGGSALFELPVEDVTLEDLKKVTDMLLKSGANIVEINTIRKHLSRVKGGNFAKLVEPAKIYSLVLSDVLGDRLDSIASGPAYPDSTTIEDDEKIIKKYDLQLSEKILRALKNETPKHLNNVETRIIGSVAKVCESAAKIAQSLGYNTMILTTTLDCEAKEAGSFLAAIAREEKGRERPLKTPCAIILGGETVVHVMGKGKGGRNQELVLSAARGIKGYQEVLIASVGTDGTDGPTDAAGGIVDGETVNRLQEKGIDVEKVLIDNDSYNALQSIGGLVITGPTGTNVNDLTFILCD
ncbi:glycerate kinase [Petrotoga sp. HKA.pet.4.5]|uniref:glycerate kinase type-2 family protein n=1 Tax=unclassified Petrotoga TaxID=2620614 RepID=UPI000EF17577|nr:MULTISPECIES: glycerate kinase [unclassified Petrotoga]RLL82665.1 glycerate kinase [Petrotoga sp. Shatin.DS.tank11.9.2.9.3]RLL89895.1 glycerate kinase [Petrotoga sp. HKA.pet.4.5]